MNATYEKEDTKEIAIKLWCETMDKEIENQPEDEETSCLMEEHDIDEEMAEKVQELVDEGLDEDDAVELADDL